MPTANSTETYHLELKPGPDPLRRRGVNRKPIYRLKRLLKYAARECGFRVSWGRPSPSVPLIDADEPEQPMIRFNDGPAWGKTLLLRRAPVFLRVTYDTLLFKWDALDQLKDLPTPGEAIFVYKLIGDPSVAYLDYMEGGRRRGGRFAVATYQLAAEQPDDATMRDTERWQAWCWSQVKKQPSDEVKP